jgi:hypothetical protein
MKEAIATPTVPTITGINLTSDQLLRELFDSPPPEPGETRESVPAATFSGSGLTVNELAAFRASQERTSFLSRRSALEKAAAQRTKLLQAQEGLQEILQVLDTLIDRNTATSLGDTSELIQARAEKLKTTYKANQQRIEAQQGPIRQGIINMQLFFDAARGSTPFRTFWLNQSEAAIRAAPLSPTGRHPVLDLGTDGDYALLTRLEDTRVSRLRASVVVLGDSLQSEDQARFWASEGYARKIPIIAGISPLRFDPLNEDTVVQAVRDLCGQDEEFAYLALVGNHIIPDLPNTPRNLVASGAFAYAGVWCRGGRVSAAQITPDGGRLRGTPSLPALQNWQTLENRAPFIWLVSTTVSSCDFELAHPSSNTSARKGTSITDTIAFSYLTRTIQHMLLTRAAGGALDEETAAKVGDEIARKLHSLTRGPRAMLTNAQITPEYADVQPDAESGLPQQVHKLSVRFPGSAEKFLVQLQIVNPAQVAGK